MAGYSGTPLERKLAIGADATIAVINAPDGFALDLPATVTVRNRLRGPLEVCLVFFTRRAEVSRRWPAITAAMTPNGGVWVAWPKKSAGVPTDLTEQSFRDLLLPTGWVDNKVCAIDETWSGLRFVLRKELRPR